MPTIRIDYKHKLWTGIKAHCPICNRTFTGWYCPTCGLPKKNSKYALNEYGSLYNCDSYHLRPEFSLFEHFQLCEKCYTTNPFNAKYCRSCKYKFTKSNGVTKDAHGWVDLGLSVLWATEIMEGRFRWMSCNSGSCDDDLNYRGDGKDAATEIWGHKWRTPTKEEFEELFTKCRWERCIDSVSKKYALKATGPNGNSIILTLDNLNIGLWTSTEYTAKYDGKAAYAFRFSNNIEIEKTLTAKQKKAMEFAAARSKRESEWSKTQVNLFSIPLKELKSALDKQWAEERKREDKEREISMQERNILYAMGDDRQERENNEKKDKEKLDNLWLSTPVKLTFNEDIISDNKSKRGHKRFGLHILPVADKKWQGKL